MTIVSFLITVLFAVLFALVFFRISYEVLDTSKQMQDTYMKIVGFLFSICLVVVGVGCFLVAIYSTLSLFN